MAKVQAIAAAMALLGLTLGPVWAEGMDDRHLDIVPRSADQTARVAAVLAPPQDFSKPQPFELRSGGAAGVPALDDRDAFSEPSGNMGFDRQMDFGLGNALFRKTWVAAPASTKASDGLGPYYNARACQDCHLRDGRAGLPKSGERLVGILLRTGVLGAGGGVLPDRLLGHQVQTFAAPGMQAEAEVTLNWVKAKTVTLADGMRVDLFRPDFAVTGHPGLAFSARLAPPMIGLGLLEAIPAADILARQDPDDANGDGVSGRAQLVPSAEFAEVMLGRFGWKAGQPTIQDQTAAALSMDMGLSNLLAPDPYGDCTDAQVACRAAAVGQEPGIRDGLEVDAESLRLLTFYSRNLAVPHRRNLDAPQVLQGKALFHDLGCAACHQPNHVTHSLANQPEQSFQLIWPYTDLLLHDMGPGLASSLPEGQASGAEWRTPPLWGLGLTAQVAEGQEARYLHDGRAGTVLEALLWHGGEAQSARDRVVSLPKSDRYALVAFLESL